MKLTLKDATPPSAAPASGARARRLDAYLFSADDAFLLELGPALGERFRTRPVERIEDLPMDSSVQWIGFIDGTRADARSCIAAIEQAHANAALIIVCSGQSLASWQSLVFRGSVCAALSLQQVGTASLDDAIARAMERLRTAAPAAAGDTARMPAVGTPDSDGKTRFTARWLVAAVVVVLTLTAIVLWLLEVRRHNASPAMPAAAYHNEPARPAVVPTQRPVLELLSLARSAFRDAERQLPHTDGHQHGESALELYALVLAQDAGNGEALDGLRRLEVVGHSRIQSDLAAGRLDEAQRLLAIFKSSGTDAATIKSLEAEVAAAQPRWLLSQTRRALAANDLAAAEQDYTQLAALGGDPSVLQDLRHAIDARQSDLQLQKMGEELRTAIAAGNLLEPAAGSARTQLQAMRQLNRTHSATLTAQHELQDALLARAREALTSAQYDAAQRWLTAAAEIGNSSEIVELRRQLQADQEKLAARAAPPVAPVVPAPVPVPVPVQDTFVIAHPLRPLSVSYPQRAADSGLQGFVVVEFTLGVDGRASRINVIESSPPGVFDKAATDAVGRGQYDTSGLDNSKQPPRARLRVSFKPR